jgi:hypothetical protein
VDYRKDGGGAGSGGTDQQFCKSRLVKGKRSTRRGITVEHEKGGSWKQLWMKWNGRKQGRGKMWCFYYEYLNHDLKARVVASVPLKAVLGMIITKDRCSVVDMTNMPQLDS